MNIPGRATGSWRWQMRAGELTDEHATRLRAAAEESGRATGSWRWQMARGALTAEHAKRLRAAAEESGRL